ncbi:MAG: type II toxin-antitoxin system VapC family toxin [Chitinispirillaceae bacterium]|nr:type II toxin-antitoxin system VapC family toxin [Chitinispirillaceae bacterium]
MNYLLDTCAISELVKKQPDSNVVRWISECDEDSLYLSVVTLGEIQKGISKLDDTRRRLKIQKWLDSDLRERFAERILPVSLEVALTWGVIEGESENKGRPLPVVDALIGATAIAHNLTVVTRNEQDIGATGARILDLWTC